MHESFVSDSSDLSILTCSHAVLSEERHYFSFSIILVLYRSHCLIIFSPTECESPLNRALSVALHNITHSAAVMFCEAHLKKKSSFVPPPAMCEDVRRWFYHRNAIKPISNRCRFVEHIPRYVSSWAKAVRCTCILVKRDSFSIHRLLLFFKKIENDWDE